MADDVKTELKLSQQLVMTPQLQLAIKLLSTPSRELAALIAGHALEPLAAGDPDPIAAPTQEELDDEAEGGPPAWRFRDAPGVTADVGVFGNPPEARANRDALPRVKVVRDADKDRIRDAAWLLRALRQRARTYEAVVGAVAALRPRLAIAEQIEPVAVREIAEKVGMHESTIARVVSAVRWQNNLGVFGLAAGKRGIVVA